MTPPMPMTAMERIEEIANDILLDSQEYEDNGGEELLADFKKISERRFLLKAFIAMREVAIEEGTSDEWRHRDVEGAIDEEFEERMK